MRGRASAVTVGHARFTAVTEACVRMEYAPDGRFIDAPSLFVIARPAHADFACETDPAVGTAVVETGVMRISYRDDGRPFHPGNLRAGLTAPAGEREAAMTWYPDKPDHGNLGGALATLDGVVGPTALAAGLLSREGFYLLDDSHRPLLANGWWLPRPSHENARDWYLFGYGLNYRAALRALTTLAGPIPLPPRYSFGSWYSRYWPHSSADFRRIVAEYRQHGYPLDVMVLDMDWHRAGWTGWSWNRALLPDAEALLAELHAQGLAVSLNVHPAEGVAPHEDAYPAFMRALGKDPGSRQVVPFNPWDPHYMRALLDTVHRPLEEAGVDFWWLDWQQIVQGLDPVLSSSILLWMNRAYFQHTASLAPRAAGGLGLPGSQAVRGRRGVSFSRWGGWGDHRHPIHFSGDAHTGWTSLGFQIPFTVASGNMGLCFWSHDIGGHLGPRDEECFTRWVQWGALSASLRLHSMRSSALDRRPWTHAAWSQRSTRIAFHLRASLFPYIYGSAAESCRDSVPLLRPMYLDQPAREPAYHNQHQYLLGRDLLVAPVVTPGVGAGRVAEQVVWFPPDTTWWHFFSGERFRGGETHAVWSDIDELPLFVRGGALIPLVAAGERMATPAMDAITLRVYPGLAEQVVDSRLYEDDGLSTDYREGDAAETPLRYVRHAQTEAATAGMTLSIGPRRGRAAGLPALRDYTLELAGLRALAAVRVNGVACGAGFDAERATATVSIPRHPADAPLIIEAWAELSDGQAESARAQARRRAGIQVAPTADPEERQRAALMSAGIALTVNARAIDPTGGVWARAVCLCDEGGAIEAGQVAYEIVDEWGTPPVERCHLHAGTGRVAPGQPLALHDHGLPPLDAAAPALDKRRYLQARFTLAGRATVARRLLAEARALPLRRWQWLDAPDRAAAEAPVLVADPAGLLQVPLAAVAGAAGEGKARLATTVYSARAQQATAILASDARAELWLEDAPVALTTVVPEQLPRTAVASLDLPQGHSRLAVVLSGGAASARFSLRCKGPWAMVQPDPPWA